MGDTHFQTCVYIKVLTAVEVPIGSLHHLRPVACIVACIVGGSIVNQSLRCFCFTHANLTIYVTETGTNCVQRLYTE